jgi:hypothetical protein
MKIVKGNEEIKCYGIARIIWELHYIYELFTIKLLLKYLPFIRSENSELKQEI